MFFLQSRQLARTFMIRLCEYSIRDYYGVSNNFYYFFRLDVTHTFSHIIVRPRPHVSGDFCIRKFFFMRIHLASTRVRLIRSVYPEISVYAFQSGNFCIRCVSGYVWTLVSVYFCIRWRHSIRTSLFPREIFHALLTNPLRCPYTNRIRVDGRIRFVYATCGRRYFVSHKKICGYKNLRIRVEGA